MHLIPESSSHFHMLVSLFPSVGLLFVLYLYGYALVKHNEGMKRTCLLAIAIFGVLAIPTYLSGDSSMDVIAGEARISQEAMNSHYIWGLVALAAILITGGAALLELWRHRKTGQLSTSARKLIFPLAIGTLVLMAVAGELGWQINHPELAFDPATQQTSQVWSHFHMILNHFPTIGLVIALGFFAAALAMNNGQMKRASLAIFAAVGVLGVPTYVTGAASMWALTDPNLAEVSQAAINAHRDMALLTMFGLALTGAAAWMELWRFQHLKRFSNAMLYAVLTFGVITLGIMAETGHRGGQINHPEIRTEPLPVDASAYLSPAIELNINQVIWFVPWQTVHFFGYSLIFGVVLAVVLRVLGFWKSVPFSAVHRMLPIGLFGVLMNVFSGMLMLLADTFRYVNNTTFAPKIAFIAIGGIAVLYFSMSERLWSVRAGEDAPASAKAVAILVLISWAGVIIGGRLLPYV